jgi:hypothetical protein
MLKQHSDFKKSEAGFRRIGSRFYSRRRVARRGQTMTEYVLLLAYLSLITLQALQNLGFITAKEYVIANCSLIVGNMQGQSPDSQYTAISNYLSDPHTWGNADASKVAAANAQILGSFHQSIYGF